MNTRMMGAKNMKAAMKPPPVVAVLPSIALVTMSLASATLVAASCA
jgi:hypothetical protein